MKISKFIFCLALSIIITGCSTINFENSSNTNVASDTKSSQWHHVVVLDLVEASKPVDLNEACEEGSGWSYVKTETTFINGLVSTVANFFLPIWYPETVEITCSI